MQNHSASTILFLTITQRAGNVPNSSNHYDGKGFKKIHSYLIYFPNVDILEFLQRKILIFVKMPSLYIFFTKNEIYAYC